MLAKEINGRSWPNPARLQEIFGLGCRMNKLWDVEYAHGIPQLCVSCLSLFFYCFEGCCNFDFATEHHREWHFATWAAL